MSYYDYFMPEAFVSSSDTYIDKVLLIVVLIDGTTWNDFSFCVVVESVCIFAMTFVYVPYDFGVLPPKCFLDVVRSSVRK